MIDDVPVKLQLELNDLHEHDLLKEKHRENVFNCIAADEFSKLIKFASGMTIVFDQLMSGNKHFQK